MRRIDTTNRSPNLFGSGKDGFRNGDIAQGVSPTEFNAEWCNAIQEELANVIEATGVALNGANNAQVLNAIQDLIDTTVSSQALTQVVADGRYAAIDDGKKPGEIFMHAGTAAPAGSLVVPTVPTNVSRTTYAALFAAIGVTYGIGNGTSTFGLPYLPEGHALLQANGNVGVQSTGTVKNHVHPFQGRTDGTPYAGATGAQTGDGTFIQMRDTSINTGGGTANLAAGLKILLCIKY